MSSHGGTESKEYRASDTLLVRIAERPLVVAALFLLTALFPWVIYFLAPLLSKVTLLDLIQWLTLPILFVLVNGLVFFLWINHAKSNTSSTATRLHEEAIHVLDEVFKKPATIEIPKPREIDEAVIFGSSSSGSISEDSEEQETKLGTITPIQPEPEAEPKKGHHKSLSLGDDVKIDLKLMDDLHQQQQAKMGSVSRRHSTPKSRLAKTTEPGSGSGKQRVSRRNTSPKSSTPQPTRMDKEQRSATLQGLVGFANPKYVPPTRIREPVPLDKDDLNARIDNFLTKFKIERQESNLRAALKSSEL